MTQRFVVSAALAAALIATSAAGAQSSVVSGAVYDHTNKTGLSGVTVRIPGTELVTTTGKDGRFTLTVPAGSIELEAIRSGYHPYKLSRLRVAANDTAVVYLALASALADATTDVQVRSETPLGTISPNAPLYIIDGVIQVGGVAPVIDPERIESLEVVRGAAATNLYGQRAANGVILITTKR